MQLAELLKDWACTVRGSIRTEVLGVEDDTRLLKKGELFVVRQGKKEDGRAYVEEAIARGACAIVVQDELLFDSLTLTIPIIWVPNCLKFLAYASARLHGFPTEALQMIAVTGTNGKTTVTHFIGQLLERLGKKTMVIGTNGVIVGGERIDFQEESLTTLPAKQLQAIVKWAVEHHVDTVVLEASSMGLATHRLDYCQIDIGVYLNLAEDHIEDHGTFEQYKQAKQQLALLSDQLVLNGDDTFCRTVGVSTKKKKLSFGTGNQVDVQWQLLNEGLRHTDGCVQIRDTQHVLTMPVSGNFQVMNVLAAMTVVLALGYSLEEIGEQIQFLTLPKGRMDYIKNNQGFDIVIDYAHTAEAMRVVLQSLHKQKYGRLLVVFSCGGERDVAKRIQMGLAASTYADTIYLTTDNPRGESPERINEHIQQGFLLNQAFEIELNRQAAIEKALRQAEVHDIVAIIGKGHEQTQTVNGEVLPFSDHQCVENYLAAFTYKQNAE